MLTTLFPSLLLLSSISNVYGIVSYANDFVDPDYILKGDFPDTTWKAQQIITQWAEDTSISGPWSVTNKSVVAPSGNPNDYMSWAPYSWPDCSSVGNTTELPQEEVWKTCPYVTRDGQFNPDGRLINDVGAFQNLSDAVLYNAMAWKFNGETSSIYSRRIAQWISTWFLDSKTKMNPNLNFAQMKRGPDGQKGAHTGVLDLKGFSKIASGILILRKGGSPDWTKELDDQFHAWCAEYITWLETTDIAIEEAIAQNNHGTFYYNQLAALKLIVNDIPGAKNVTQTYFNTLYQNQIDQNGEQPLEAARTRPYHYRAYNLAAMITNARLEKYADPSSDVWNRTTGNGTTIKNALDFAMEIPADGEYDESSYAAELYPSIVAVGSIYGDPERKYYEFMRTNDVLYWQGPYFLWNQPFAGGTASPSKTATGTADDDGDKASNGGLGARTSSAGFLLAVSVALGFFL